jgi:hypothetical protein
VVQDGLLPGLMGLALLKGDLLFEMAQVAA